MNRQKRHLVVLVVAVATATIASVGVYRAVDRMPVREVPLAHQSVVVAARALPLGTQLTEHDVKVVAWPAASPLAGAFGSIGDVVNRPLIASVLENEPLVPAKLAPREGGAGLPSAIPRGMRAISVKVNDVIGVAGFIQPGSRVDLMVTIRRQSDSVTRTVASNVQVMTAGTRQEQQQKPTIPVKDPTPAAVVTLMVTPGGRRTYRARAVRRSDHARAPEPVGRRSSHDVRGTDGCSAWSGGSSACPGEDRRAETRPSRRHRLRRKRRLPYGLAPLKPFVRRSVPKR